MCICFLIEFISTCCCLVGWDPKVKLCCLLVCWGRSMMATNILGRSKGEGTTVKPSYAMWGDRHKGARKNKEWCVNKRLGWSTKCCLIEDGSWVRPSGVRLWHPTGEEYVASETWYPQIRQMIQLLTWHHGAGGSEPANTQGAWCIRWIFCVWCSLNIRHDDDGMLS